MSEQADRQIPPIQIAEKLIAAHGGSRARTLMGTLEFLKLYGREGVLERKVLSEATLYRDLADIRVAGLLEPLESAERLGAAMIKLWEMVELMYGENPTVPGRLMRRELERGWAERDAVSGELGTA
jgi:hypothetical protein